MSLKTIHIVLILSAILLAFGFGGWEFHRYRQLENQIDLFFGIGSSVAGVALLIYGVYFLKKTKNISYL